MNTNRREVDWTKFEVVKKRNLRSFFRRRRVICFIHGFTSSFASHETVFRPLIKRGYRFFAFNLPAHGNSLFEFDNDDLKIDNFVQLVISFIQFHKLKNVILIGHSMGGAIATTVRSLIPERIRCLILEDPLNRGTINSKEMLRFFFRRDSEGKLNILHPLKNYRLSYKNNPNYRRILHDILAPRTIKWIGGAYEKIGDCPTLLIFGENDQVIEPVSSIRYISRYATNLTVKIIPEAGHSPSSDQPEIYLMMILDFLEKLDEKNTAREGED